MPPKEEQKFNEGSSVSENGKLVCKRCKNPLGQCRKTCVCKKCKKTRRNCTDLPNGFDVDMSIPLEGKNEKEGEKKKNEKEQDKKKEELKINVPKNLFNVTLENMAADYEDPAILVAYDEVSKSLDRIQQRIYGNDIDSQVTNSNKDITNIYNDLLKVNAELEEQYKKSKSSVTHAISKIAHTKELVEYRNLTVSGIYDEIRKIRDNLNEYLKLVTGENRRLRILNTVQNSDLLTKSGKKCIDYPEEDPWRKGVYRCHTSEKKKAWGVGPWGVPKLYETEENVLEDVDADVAKNFKTFAKAYEKTYKFGGLGNTQLVQQIVNNSHLYNGDKLIVISPGVIIQGKLSGEDILVNIPVPVSSKVVVVENFNIGGGQTLESFVKVKVKFVNEPGSILDKKLEARNINKDDVYNAIYNIDIDNLGKYINVVY